MLKALSIKNKICISAKCSELFIYWHKVAYVALDILFSDVSFLCVQIQKWHIHTGYIYIICLCYLTTCSLRLFAWGVPHFHLVLSNGFSLLCMDIDHVKLLDSWEIYSHWLHLWDFTPKQFLFTMYFPMQPVQTNVTFEVYFHMHFKCVYIFVTSLHSV